jgi:hypothetical protein
MGPWSEFSRAHPFLHFSMTYRNPRDETVAIGQWVSTGVFLEKCSKADAEEIAVSGS